VKHIVKQLTMAAVLALAGGVSAHADITNFSGSITGTASTDAAGRCTASLTVNATGTGVATLLGDFLDVQSHCMTSESSFDQGVFDFASLTAPDDSLFGTYFAVATSQDGILEFDSILLVTGGTGLFANDFGALFGLGTLDENTGALNETFSGQLEATATVPEPDSKSLIAIAAAALWYLNRKRISSMRAGAVSTFR
jgi:hypothetical protein